MQYDTTRINETLILNLGCRWLTRSIRANPPRFNLNHGFFSFRPKASKFAIPGGLHQYQIPSPLGRLRCKVPGYARGDVEASIWPTHYIFSTATCDNSGKVTLCCNTKPLKSLSEHWSRNENMTVWQSWSTSQSTRVERWLAGKHLQGPTLKEDFRKVKKATKHHYFWRTKAADRNKNWT